MTLQRYQRCCGWCGVYLELVHRSDGKMKNTHENLTFGRVPGCMSGLDRCFQQLASRAMGTGQCSGSGSAFYLSKFHSLCAQRFSPLSAEMLLVSAFADGEGTG